MSGNPPHHRNERTVNLLSDTDKQAPTILDIPIRVGMHRDAAGVRPVSVTSEVPADRYWAPQTQRRPGALQHRPRQDAEGGVSLHAYGYVKKAAAIVNTRAGRLPAWKGELIERVCDEVDQRGAR